MFASKSVCNVQKPQQTDNSFLPLSPPLQRFFVYFKKQQMNIFWFFCQPFMSSILGKLLKTFLSLVYPKRLCVLVGSELRVVWCWRLRCCSSVPWLKLTESSEHQLMQRFFMWVSLYRKKADHGV